MWIHVSIYAEDFPLVFLKSEFPSSELCQILLT